MKINMGSNFVLYEVLNFIESSHCLYSKTIFNKIAASFNLTLASEMHVGRKQ